MKPLQPIFCPLCKSFNVQAYKVGWSVVSCRNCYLSLSRPIPLAELIAIWNDRDAEDPMFSPKLNAAQRELFT